METKQANRRNSNYDVKSISKEVNLHEILSKDVHKYQSPHEARENEDAFESFRRILKEALESK